MTPIFRTLPSAPVADPTLPHLVLIGLPGAGKTTVGQAVAERLERGFLDFDLEIERREARSIGQIFAERGEPYFRQRERELTEELTKVGNLVVSPGGGWVTNAEALALLRPASRIIYLKVRPETALERLGPMRSLRPLLSRPDPAGELSRLLASRRVSYESADHVINTELYSLQRVIEKVIELASGGA